MKRKEAEGLLKQFKGRLAFVRDEKKKLRALMAYASTHMSKDDIPPPEKMSHSANYNMFRGACVEEQTLLQEIKYLERILQKD